MTFAPLPEERPKRSSDDRITVNSPCVCGSSIQLRLFKGQQYRKQCNHCGKIHQGVAGQDAKRGK